MYFVYLIFLVLLSNICVAGNEINPGADFFKAYSCLRDGPNPSPHANGWGNFHLDNRPFDWQNMSQIFAPAIATMEAIVQKNKRNRFSCGPGDHWTIPHGVFKHMVKVCPDVWPLVTIFLGYKAPVLGAVVAVRALKSRDLSQTDCFLILNVFREDPSVLAAFNEELLSLDIDPTGQ